MSRLIQSTRLLFTAALLAGAASQQAMAIDDIPVQPGFSGFVLPGVGYMDFKSNTVAGNSLINVDRSTVSSIFAGPESESDYYALVSGEVKYTFADGATQVFLGSSLEDIVTLDFSQALGVRRDFDATGIVELGLLFSGLPTDVWADPYVAGQPREETDRDSKGLRLRWDRILGTALELELAYREINIDNERSGESLGLSDADRQLLRRDADRTSVGLTWRGRLSDTTVLSPEFRYSSNDADGAAMSFDSYGLQVTWAYLGRPLAIVGTVGYTARDFDAANPIYDRRQDSNTYLISGTAIYQLPTASRRWSATGIVAFGREDSDISFLDGEVFSVITGIQYRFGLLAP